MPMTCPPTTVAVILIDASGHVLMQQRDNKVGIHYPGLWSVPGGLVEDGELLEEAARREFLEETGCRLEDLGFLSADDHRHPDGTTTRRNFFWSRYDGKQEIRCYEGQAVRFVTPAEFPAMKIVPGLEETIRRALREWGALQGGSSNHGAQVQH